MVIFHPIDLLTAATELVTEPGPASIWPLFLASFLNDLIGLFPFALVLAGQLAFLKGLFTLTLAAKLLLFVALPVGIGAAVGSIPFYVLSYVGGKALIVKYGKYFRVNWEKVEQTKHYFQGTHYDEVVFFVLRCLPVLPSIPLDLGAGVIRMPFARFLILTTVGSVLRMMITLLVVGLSLRGLSQF